MNFVKSLSMFHVNAKEIPCLTAKGAPTEQTEGAPGVLYMDTDTGELYKCTAADYVNKVFTWKPFLEGNSSSDSSQNDYQLPMATAETLGGVKADPVTSADTQPVRIGADSKLYTTPTTSEGGSGDGLSPYKVILSGSVDEDINMIEFTGINEYSEFLFIGELKGGNTSGVYLFINGKAVGIKMGSYFVHNHEKLNVTNLEIDRERRIYFFESSSQQLNTANNHDTVSYGIWGQTLTGDNPITSFGFKLDTDKFFKAGSTYTLWGR